ncbi:hypothetical protein Cfor_02769 [Coptotermes formosanus]|uniref:Uncharacterized protein n=1 Tax=Coptotermes formosanus TaxID=36987 RepID=A0A6L2QA87_COPFO|nr:hypothetical protein Cfor_02769 [Coptotermes formosanus]
MLCPQVFPKQHTAFIVTEKFSALVCLKCGVANHKSHMVLMAAYCYGRLHYCCQPSDSTGADCGSSGTGLCCSSLPVASQASAAKTATLR